MVRGHWNEHWQWIDGVNCVDADGSTGGLAV